MNRNYDWSRVKNLCVRNGWCHARVQMNGKAYLRSLHIEADPEGRNAEDVQEALRAFKVELARNTFAILKLTKSRDEHSKFSDIFLAYRKACEGRDISEDTVDSNIKWMELILRTVYGEKSNTDELRASALASDDLARDFQEKRIAAIKAKATADSCTPEQLEQRMKKGKNSIKSAIQQARSLFARELLQSRHYRPLVLPNLDAFMRFKAEGSTISAFVRPSTEIWDKIVAGAPTLKTTDLARWYAFQLGINCGLRRGSARNARWAWFKEVSVPQEKGPDLIEAEMEVKRAKGGNYFVRLPADLWSDLKAAKSSTDYVIPRATDEEREAAIDEVVDWLRSCGLTADIVDKPFHLLRKIFGNEIVKIHGLTEGQNALGHSTSNLTHAVYAEHRSTRAARVC